MIASRLMKNYGHWSSTRHIICTTQHAHPMNLEGCAEGRCSPTTDSTTLSRQVTEDIEELRLNTAISCMMEFINGCYKWKSVPKETMLPFVCLLSPFAPHVAEELWQVGFDEPLQSPKVYIDVCRRDEMQINDLIDCDVRFICKDEGERAKLCKLVANAAAFNFGPMTTLVSVPI